jgi:hypothetical protein
MSPNDYPKFIEALVGAHDFYGKELSEFGTQVWIEAVKTFDLAQVLKALSAHLMDPARGQYMPKPSDIVRNLQGTQTDRSLVAWGKVAGAMSSVGAYSDVVFDDPLIHLCVADLGGWVKVCRTTYDEQSYLQHRFCESYRAYASRGVPVDYPARLTGAGSGQDDYAKRGLMPPAPCLVGDVKAARLVLAGGSAAKQLSRSVLQALPVAITGAAA